MDNQPTISMHFSEYFKVAPTEIEDYGAFNVSVINDLPLFIDPFLLFNSAREDYQKLHEDIIQYLCFLRDEACSGNVAPGLLGAWYTFSEVKQTWLGFSQVGNKGRGLGSKFANALSRNLATVFTSFGREHITKGTHLEKLTLIEDGVGRDMISDFTTNLIKEYLLCYTQEFARQFINPNQRRTVTVNKTRFNYQTLSWQSRRFDLPFHDNDYVILTPRDMLTKDDTWISKADLMNSYYQVADALPDYQLRAQVNEYLMRILPERPSDREQQQAISATLAQFPQLIEYYIRLKEDTGDQAVSISEQKVSETTQLFVQQMRQLATLLRQYTQFYQYTGDTYTEARQRVMYLKDVIENKGGHRLFYVNGQPVRREDDLHILFRLAWCATVSDVSSEVNDGRGPADFKISRGAFDKTIVEFKLASNTQLRRNLERQVPIYQKASDAQGALKVIVFFTEQELSRLNKILSDLDLTGNEDIFLVDARSDNKPSASKA